MDSEEEIIYTGLINKYGKSNQIIKAIEELAELQKELCKYLCISPNVSSMERIAEEIADVEIMLAQIKKIIPVRKLIENYKIEKVKRISYILENS